MPAPFGANFFVACEVLHRRSGPECGNCIRIVPITRRHAMKMLVTAAALATIIASPAFAEKAPKVSPNAVVVDGQVVGQDPDPKIRFELRKEYMHGID
jgi:hypothetical protein